MTSQAHPTSWQPPKLIPNPYTRYGLLLAVVIYLIWSLDALDIARRNPDRTVATAIQGMSSRAAA